MKPQIRVHPEERSRFWAEGMRCIADETGACRKLSALVTDAAEQWCVEHLKPHVGHILKVFGCDRIIWGSDWPVRRLRTAYPGWFEAAECLTEGVPASDGSGSSAAMPQGSAGSNREEFIKLRSVAGFETNRAAA